MSTRQTAGEPRGSGGARPAVVALVATAAVVIWLLLGTPGGPHVGFAGGPVVLAAAALTARRIASRRRRPGRSARSGG